MAENPKLDMDFPCEMGELEDARKITVSDHMNGLQYSADSEKPDSFVIDMESVPLGSNRDVRTPASRITLQRSLSRKGSPRMGSGNCGVMAGKEGDPVATCSPRAATVGQGMLEKPTAISTGATEHSSNPQGHHQITITTNNMSTNAESRLNLRKNSFRRHSQSWLFDPKRVLIFFATLSCMGTMLLIYFTLTISKPDADNSELDWQQ